MSDYQRVQDRDDLENRISDVLTDYLKDESMYGGVYFLRIDSGTLEVDICEAEIGDKNDLYALSDFTGTGDKDINYDRIYDVASRYVFVQ